MALELTITKSGPIVIHRDGEPICTLEFKGGTRGQALISFDADRAIGIDRQVVFNEKYPSIENDIDAAWRAREAG